MTARRWPTGPRTIFFSGEVSRPTVAQARKDGQVVRLAAGVWSADVHSAPEDIVAENLWRIVAKFCPDAILVDRTAARGGLIDGGVLTVATDERTTPLALPGVTVLVRPRVEHPSDTSWAADLRGSTPARALVDNLAESRGRPGRPGRTLARAELEDWVAQKRLAWGADRFAVLEQDAVQVAEDLDVDPDLVRELVGAVSGASTAAPARGVFARAALDGRAWDERRVAMFTTAVGHLPQLDVEPLEPPAEDGELPFYEAYFSNYIEGTEFTIEEAREIIETQTPPARRAADGHDILGTHRCVVDPIGRAATDADPEAAIELMRARHRALMVGRPNIGPGHFKDRSNRAGATQFVAPDLVYGTLLEGLRLAPQIAPGFCRAVYVMSVVSEVHPFTDGNGRVGRLMMNAELSTVGLCRIVIPTVLRNEYIAARRRFSNHDGDPAALVPVLRLAWRWTAAMPWTDRAAVDGQMVATNALMDSTDAANERVHLTLP
ncbi:MAG: Fic family protein [Nitriliruptor sp.]|uniref:Fic family protein n=1 Tax=Nitriliruptor sp. TaxID=2448056 RepID=UPI0034A043B6